MPGTFRAGSYAAVLRLPTARRVFALGLVGRSTYGVLPLSMLFTFRDLSDSFGTAGVAMALYAASSIVMPLKSRAADRHGPRSALVPMACGLAAVLLLTAGLASAEITLGPLLCSALAVLAGLLAPPLGPSMRARWHQICDGTDMLATSYALDAVCEEALYLIGPIAVGITLSVGAPWIPLIAAAALVVIGTTGMTWDAEHLTADTTSPGSWLVVGPIRHKALQRVLALVLVFATCAALMGTAIAGFAAQRGNLGIAGYLEATLAVGSVIGGLAWGRFAAPGAWHQQIASLFAGLAIAAFALGATASTWLVAVLLAIGGLTIAPVLITSYVASDLAVAEVERTEASTWINTANNLGVSIGTAVAGLALVHHDAQYVFRAAGFALAIGAVVTAITGWHRPGHDSSPPTN